MFRLAKLILAVLKQLATTLIRRDRLFEGETSTFHFLDDLLKFGEGCLEFFFRWILRGGWRCVAPNLIVCV